MCGQYISFLASWLASCAFLLALLMFQMHTHQALCMADIQKELKELEEHIAALPPARIEEASCVLVLFKCVVQILISYTK